MLSSRVGQFSNICFFFFLDTTVFDSIFWSLRKPFFLLCNDSIFTWYLIAFEIDNLVHSTRNFSYISSPILKIFTWLERKWNNLSKYVICICFYLLNFFYELKTVFCLKQPKMWNMTFLLYFFQNTLLCFTKSKLEDTLLKLMGLRSVSLVVVRFSLVNYWALWDDVVVFSIWLFGFSYYPINLFCNC